jgi:multidrug efflux pump subunit AcrB
MNDLMKLIVITAFIAVIVIFGPLITIWSLNTLFPVLAIPSNIATWFATLWVFGFFAMKGKK